VSPRSRGLDTHTCHPPNFPKRAPAPRRATMERLAASLLPAVSPSPASSPSAHRASAAAYFPSSRSVRQGLRLRSHSSQVGLLAIDAFVSAGQAGRIDRGVASNELWRLCAIRWWPEADAARCGSSGAWRHQTRRSSRARGRTSNSCSRPPTATPLWYASPPLACTTQCSPG
jgi:hypothetical protein